MSNKAILKATLQWYLDQGVDEMLEDEAVDRTLMPVLPVVNKDSAVMESSKRVSVSKPLLEGSEKSDGEFSGNIFEMQSKAASLVSSCNDLKSLEEAIKNFDGLAIKKTAMNMVFADGNPKSNIMVIGEAPFSDDDRQGKPFMGVEGQLLDKILASIGLSRNSEDINQSVYLTNVLNWRPPGNRTPSQAEIDISLPFIKRHIELISPELLILLGGYVGNSLLDKKLSISKFSGSFHDFHGVPTIVTYPPKYLLATPARKRAVWQDMLMFDAKREELGLK